MRLTLLLCTLSAACLCLASGHSQPDAPTPKSVGYPKKVTTLKKRPTKTPSTLPATLTTASRSTVGISKPSKPRVKVSTKGTTTTPTTTPAPVPKPATAAQLSETFKNLPEDDLEFIKELDKQFKLHGDKIKIKVERENVTSSKTNKRTIDGELGYGYTHPGYDYAPPKFMFYPYSQHDIPATEEPGYTAYSPAGYEQAQVTSVTIEPSYSYELKPQTSYEAQQPAQHDQQPQIDLPHGSDGHGSEGDAGGNYQEPVIVLRIPGPAKYAAHLQTLLQQYLEIRAAQYLRLLEEAEQRKQHQQHVQHVELSPQSYETPESHDQAHYHPDVSYAHQLAPTPMPVQYAPIDDVYQSYKGRHHQQEQQQQQQQQQSHQPEQLEQQQQYEQPTADAYYDDVNYQTQPQFYYAPQQPQYEHAYQPQLYLIAMAAQPQQHQPQQHQPQQHHSQPIYVPDAEPMAAPAAADEESSHHGLPITENNPRSTHTKVVFTPHSAQAGQSDYAANMYVLPSIRPYERHASTAAAEEQAEQQQHYAQPSGDVSQDYQAPQHDESSDADAVSITQRPYNYHAHGLVRMRQGTTTKRDAAAPEAAASGQDQQLQQIRKYVREKLGAEMGTAVEYKTTQLLEG